MNFKTFRFCQFVKFQQKVWFAPNKFNLNRVHSLLIFLGDNVKGLGALLTTAPKRLKAKQKNDELGFGPDIPEGLCWPNPNSILAV